MLKQALTCFLLSEQMVQVLKDGEWMSHVTQNLLFFDSNTHQLYFVLTF